MNIIELNLNFKSLTKRKNTGGIVLHHRGGNGDIASIHKQHLAQGWSGIGYHYYVRKDGTTYSGRPVDMIGAHASGHNYNTIGICAEGNFETEQMSEIQKNAIKELVSYLKRKYNIKFIKRHSDFSSTACPGKNFPFDDIVTNCSSKAEANEDDVVKNKEGKKSIVRAGQIHANNFSGANIVVDGVRGSNTIKAGIKVLQTAMNLDYKAKLSIDGVWGAESKSKLGKHYVKRGETQYMVTAVEILLMLKGYECNLECPGVFGANLENTVKNYQKDYQLTIDGVVGYNTFMSLIH